MTDYAALGERIKQKYPQYANTDSEMLGVRVAKKFPEMAQETTTRPSDYINVSEGTSVYDPNSGSVVYKNPKTQTPSTSSSVSPSAYLSQPSTTTQLPSFPTQNLQNTNNNNGQSNVTSNNGQGANTPAVHGQIVPSSPLPSFTERIGQGAVNLGKSIASPFINTARNIIGTPIAIAAMLEKGGSRGNLEKLAEKVLPKGASQDTRKNLVKQAQDSINVGSFAIPFGKGANIATKALLPGAAVGGAQSFSTTDLSDPSKATKEVIGGALLGAGTAGVLQGASKLAGGIKNLTGKGLEKAGESLATKSLRPSPSQLYNFKNETGEEMVDFLKRNNLQGADFDKITKTLEPLQKSFDDVVSNPRLKVDPNDLLNRFSDEINTLRKSVLPADRTKADTLEKIAQNLIDVHGGEPIGSDVLTKLRRDIDKSITDFALDPAVKTPLNTARDIIQGSIRDTADKAGITFNGLSVKEVGRELSKMYKLQEIAEKTQYKGQGSLPVGIIQLLGGGAGGLLGGVPGAVAGYGLTNALNNPKTVGIASKALSGVGTFAQKSLPSQISNISGQISGQASRLPSMPSLVSPEAQGNNQTGDSTLNDVQDNIHTDIVSPDKPQSRTGYSLDQLGRAYTDAAIAGDEDAAKQIKALYDLEEDYQKTQQTADKPKSAAGLQVEGKAKAANLALDTIESLISSDPNVVFKASIPGAPGSRQYEAAVSSLTDAIGGLRTGASVSREQQKFYRNLLPKIGDSSETIQYKLKAVRDEINTYLGGSTDIQPTDQLPSIPTQSFNSGAVPETANTAQSSLPPMPQTASMSVKKGSIPKVIPTPTVVTQKFGNKNKIERFSKGINRGTDFRAKSNTPLSAPQGEWEVAEAFDKARPKGYIGNPTNQGYGNSVVLRNVHTGERIRMSHLSRVNVDKGDVLKGGQILGSSGTSGNSQAPHLDVEYFNADGNLSDVLKSPYRSSFI